MAGHCNNYVNQKTLLPKILECHKNRHWKQLVLDTQLFRSKLKLSSKAWLLIYKN